MPSGTIPSLSFGAAATDRIIAIGLSAFLFSPAISISSVTIGGITATPAATSGSSQLISAIYYAQVPSGTQGDIVVNFSDSAPFAIGASVYRIVGENLANPLFATAVTATASPTESVSGSISVPNGSVLIATSSSEMITNDTSGISWSGNVSQDMAATVGFFGGAFLGYSSASRGTTLGGSTITADNTNGLGINMEIAAATFQGFDTTQFGVIGAATCEY